MNLYAVGRTSVTFAKMHLYVPLAVVGSADPEQVLGTPATLQSTAPLFMVHFAFLADPMLSGAAFAEALRAHIDFLSNGMNVNDASNIAASVVGAWMNMVGDVGALALVLEDTGGVHG
jgi:hypothetical protein